MNLRKLAVWALVAALAVPLAAGAAFAAEAGASCPYCGMEQAKFGHSWMEITYDDGAKKGFCSLHCAAIDMALHIDKVPQTVMVGDYNTKEQIDAEKAHWVIGGDKMGVMTTRAKWAFKDKAAADAFMAEHGGEPATYENAIKGAFEDMYEDIRMIQKKRQMMKMRKEHGEG
jgi:nitrous oxide reductase accessory protein NosL